MDALSARQVAARLGTSAPRVLRAARRLGILAEGDSSRARLAPEDVDRLIAEIGVRPKIPGMPTTDAIVLATMARAPLGLPSIRAIAARSGLSPTAVSASVERLAQRDLLRRETHVIARGSARPTELIVANVGHPEWHSVAARLGEFRPPRAKRARSRPTRVPASLRHLFWNVPTGRLSLPADGPAIARRLLTVGDLEGIAWGAAALMPTDWGHAARTRGIPSDMRALADNLAEAAARRATAR